VALKTEDLLTKVSVKIAFILDCTSFKDQRVMSSPLEILLPRLHLHSFLPSMLTCPSLQAMIQPLDMSRLCLSNHFQPPLHGIHLLEAPCRFPQTWPNPILIAMLQVLVINMAFTAFQLPMFYWIPVFLMHALKFASLVGCSKERM
jgi:hypothetical protein